MILALNSFFDRIRSVLDRQRGVSLIEVAAALPLGALVLVLLSIAISSFLTTYEETKLYTQLQEELFHAVEAIRYGYAKEGITDNVGLIGLLTAQDAVIRPDRQAVTIKPLVVIQGTTEELYTAEFYLLSGELRTSARYNTLYYQNEPVFPSGNNTIGGEKQFRITDLEFIPEIQEQGSGKVYMLGIDIEARVRFRARSSGQSVDDDLRINTRTIRYKTSVLLGNS